MSKDKRLLETLTSGSFSSTEIHGVQFFLGFMQQSKNVKMPYLEAALFLKETMEKLMKDLEDKE